MSNSCWSYVVSATITELRYRGPYSIPQSTPVQFLKQVNFSKSYQSVNAMQPGAKEGKILDWIPRNGEVKLCFSNAKFVEIHAYPTVGTLHQPLEHDCCDYLLLNIGPGWPPIFKTYGCSSLLSRKQFCVYTTCRTSFARSSWRCRVKCSTLHWSYYAVYITGVQT